MLVHQGAPLFLSCVFLKLRQPSSPHTLSLLLPILSCTTKPVVQANWPFPVSKTFDGIKTMLKYYMETDECRTLTQRKPTRGPTKHNKKSFEQQTRRKRKWYIKILTRPYLKKKRVFLDFFFLVVFAIFLQVGSALDCCVRRFQYYFVFMFSCTRTPAPRPKSVHLANNPLFRSLYKGTLKKRDFESPFIKDGRKDGKASKKRRRFLSIHHTKQSKALRAVGVEGGSAWTRRITTKSRGSVLSGRYICLLPGEVRSKYSCRSELTRASPFSPPAVDHFVGLTLLSRLAASSCVACFITALPGSTFMRREKTFPEGRRVR